MLADLLRTFAAEHGACAADIEQLLREQRLAAAAAALHRVKGAAHIVGAESVRAAAQALEEEVRHGRSGDISAFAHALSDAVENIRQHVAAVPAERVIGAVDAYKS